MVNCIIVEDEYLLSELLEGYIKLIPQLNLVQKCSNAVEAMTALRAHKVDLMFLDIQMPQLTGIEFLNTLNEKPEVIFTTAYEEYALEGYELNAIDYLLKPIKFDRFTKAVNKAINQVELKNKANEMDSSSPFDSERDYIIVKADGKLVKINHDDILFVEAMREYVRYHTTGKKIVSLQSISKLEEMLPKSTFIRVQKSYIISINKVNSMNGNMIEIGENKIPIGNTYKQKVVGRVFK